MISTDTAAILDPHKRYTGSGKRGWDGDLREFLSHDGHAACFESHSCFGLKRGVIDYKATLFRFPLRKPDANSEISSNSYSPQQVKNFLFTSFIKEAPIILLFLKHVQEIGLYDGERLVYKVSIHPNHIRMVESERKALIELGLSNPKDSSLRLYSMSIVAYDACVGSRSEYHWLIMNMIGSSFGNVNELSKKLVILPWVGIAAPLPRILHINDISLPNFNISQLAGILQHIQAKLKSHMISLPWCDGVQGHTDGHAFCFLPLPNITYLPVNIHGYFAVGDNRRSIEWPASDNKSDKAVWNQELVLKHIAPLYSMLLGCRSQLVRYTGTPLPLVNSQGDITDPYAAWPLCSEVRHKEIWSELVKPTITGSLDAPILWTAAEGGKWVKVTEAVFLPPTNEFPFPKEAVEVLLKANICVVSLPNKIRQTFTECKLGKHLQITVNPALVRQALKQIPIIPRDFNHLFALLECILHDINHDNCQDLVGINLLPLATQVFRTEVFKYSPHSNDEIVYVLESSMNMVLQFLPGVEDLVMNTTVQDSPSVYRVMIRLAKWGKLQLRLLTPESLCQTLLPISMKSWVSFKHHQSVKWQPGRKKCHPSVEWIKRLWSWLCRNPSTLGNTVGVPILPQQVVTPDVQTVTLLSLPSSKESYFVKQSGEEEERLGLMLQKMGATIVCENPFVFDHRNISQYILPMTVPNILQYLGDPSKVSLLSSDEKSLLRSSIAQYYYRNSIPPSYKSLLLQLPIYEVGVGATPVSLVSLQYSSQYILPDPNIEFDASLNYPSDILNNQERDVVSLLSSLGYRYQNADDIYLSHILPFAVTQCNGSSSWCNGDRLIVWVLNKVSSLSPQLKHFFASQQFIRTKAMFGVCKKASELYNPNDEQFQNLFDTAVDKVFPADIYQEKGVMHKLLSFGIISWRNLAQSQDNLGAFLRARAQSVKYLSHDVALRRSCYILELIGTYRKYSECILAQIQTVEFLHVETEIPTSFPSFLPWHGATQKEILQAPNKLCFETTNSCLAGSVLSVMSGYYREHLQVQLPSNIVRFFLTPSIGDVIQQLEVLVRSVKTRSLQTLESKQVSRMVHDIYAHLNANSKDVVASTLPSHWIWWKGENDKYTFMHAKKFVLESPIPLSPFIYNIESDKQIAACKHLLKISGIRTSLSSMDIVNVLQEIKTSCPTNIPDKYIRKAADILQYLQQWKKSENSGYILVPTVENRLYPANQCTYDDREWIKKKVGAGISKYRFVHDSIPPNTARYFGVEPLSKRVAPSQKLKLGYTKVGPKERVTRRISGIVNDYSGNINVFKELIQNADDAGASEVKLLVDWRYHGQEYLFEDEMKHWQGPALVAYNNATFSDQDFDNICELAAEAKMSDPLKTGRFGVGFCACYSLTDVPSFISRHYFTIFDPHTKYLGDRVSHNEPGMRLDVVEQQEGLKIYEHQFAPFDGLFGCQIFDLHGDGFNGTIFRLPLRMAGAPTSEITNEHYDMKKMVADLQKEAAKLLLFLKRVQVLEMFELGKGAKSGTEMKLLFKVEKNSQNPSARIEMIQQYITSPEMQQKPICNTCNISIETPKSKIEIFQYLQASAIGTTKVSSKKGMIPLAELAVEITDNGFPIPCKDGRLFCFLPLPLDSFLPFHVNGYFDVGKNRSSLKEPQNSPEYNWNKSLIENALPLAFECVLGHITKQPKLVRLDVDSKNDCLKAYYSLWPGAYSKMFNTAGRSWVSEVFANSVESVLQKTEECLVWSDVNRGKWICPSEAYVFEDDTITSLPPGIQNNTTELLLAEGYSIINIEYVPHVACLLNTFLKSTNHLFDYKRFFEDVFIPNLQKMEISTRNKHLFFVVGKICGESYEKSFKWAVDTLKNNCCIPVAGSSKLARPDQLIDVRCKPIASLYDTADGRFPGEAFVENAMDALIILGIITKELPVSELAERAKTVNILNEEDARKRMENILHYIAYIEHSEQSVSHYQTSHTSKQNSRKRKERIAALHNIPFLKALPKPDGPSIPWYEAENSFLSPSELYLPKHLSLIFNQKPIFHPRALSTEMNFETEKMMLYLGIDRQEPEVDIVLNNLCQLMESLKDTQMDNKITEFLNDRTFFPSMYKYLNSKCRTEQAKLIKAKLSNTSCIWQEGRLHSPDQMLFSWEGKSCFPYLCSLSLENKTFEDLFQLIGVEREATFDYLLSIPKKMCEYNQSTALSAELLEFVDAVTKKLDTKLSLQRSKEISEEIFLPDEQGILRPASTLSCDSNLKGEWMKSLLASNEFMGHFIHDSIPRERALKLGAIVIIDAVLKKFEDNDFLDGTDFGQHEELVDRLNGILKKYPADTSIFKEFIQNAEDAKASEIVFVLDQRTDHPDCKLFSETEKWKELQHTPALCIFNNRPFTEEHIQGICRLGRGGKGDTADTIGRFGIGFNVAYHLTDCPSFVSYNQNGCPNDFCVFDPLRKYCPKANCSRPGRRWKTREKNLEQFADQFHPYITNKFSEMQSLIPSCFSNLDQGFTVFRLPLIHWKPDDSKTQHGIPFSYGSASKKEEMWLKESRASELYQVKSLINQLKQSSENMLLFLNHLKHISMFEIHQDGKCLHHFTTTSTKDIVSTDLSNVSTKPVSLSCEITLHHHITTDDDSVVKEDSKWIINQRFGLPEDQFNDIQVTAKERGMDAFGAIAAQLGNTKPLNGSLFCFLPMNISSCLPVHLNAHFLVDDSHKHFHKLPELEEWNPTVAEHILVPSYIDLILKARDYVDGSEDTITWFYNLFPNLTRDETSEASSLKINYLLYEHLLMGNYPILLDRRFIVDGEVKWLQINSGDIGYFCLDFLRFGYTDSDPTDILLLLDMPITCAPEYIFKSLCKISKDYFFSTVGLITPDKVVQHLKKLDVTKNENEDIIKKRCLLLLNFCLSNCLSKKIKAALTGTPLLLTLADTLDSSGSLFESKYSSLLPHCYHRFISQSLERSETIYERLRDGGVIVGLPVYIVAREIKLSNVDEPVELSDEDKHLVALLWQYLEYSTSLSDVIIDYFNNKPIIPTSQGTFYPPSLGKSVFLEKPCQTGVLSAVKKLGYHTVDFSKVGFSSAPSVVHSLVSEASSPSDMIKCLQLCSPKLTSEMLFTATEANGMINLFSQCPTIPSDIATILKRLPLFETANGSYMCLSDAKKFFIMPLMVPIIGIQTIETATQQIVLHLPGHNAEQFYNKIISESEYASAKPSTIQFYLQFLVPNFNNLTDSEMIVHLRYIHSNFFQSAQNLSQDHETLVGNLRRTPLITKDGKRFLVSEFYDPAVKYHVAFNNTKLPPPEWSTDEWIQFLRQLGLQRDVDNNAWLSKAKKTADDAAKLSNDKPSKELIERSESLISSLKDMIYYKQKQITEGTIEHLDINFISFLTKASKIRFIYCPNPCRLEILLQTVTNRRLTQYKHFTLFHEAVYHKSQDLAGLFRAILPTSCDFLTLTKGAFSNALSIREPLNPKTVITNLIALSVALSLSLMDK